MDQMAEDEYWIKQALAIAANGAKHGEVPVGAVVVNDGRLVGEGFNKPISGHDPTAHAEIVALRAAGLAQQNYRLPGHTLYVTLEPCIMCAGAIIHSRIDRVVFGAWEPKGGAVSSVYDVISVPRLNHQVEWTGGVLEGLCADMLRAFFKERR